jgi:uncharacterized protein (DUF433 family)
MNVTKYLSIAGAAFVSGLRERELNRVIDEMLVTDELIVHSNGDRSFSPLGIAFAKFYFRLAPILSATSRKLIINQAYENFHAQGEGFNFLDEVVVGAKSWEISVDLVRVDIAPFVREVWSNLRLVDAAESSITQDDSVMYGRPVFKGTRLPVDMVVGVKEQSISIQEAQEAYPFLTKEQIEAAEVYLKLHPPRGRPRRLAEVNPKLKVLRPRAKSEINFGD